MKIGGGKLEENRLGCWTIVCVCACVRGPKVHSSLCSQCWCRQQPSSWAPCPLCDARGGLSVGVFETPLNPGGVEARRHFRPLPPAGRHARGGAEVECRWSRWRGIHTCPRQTASRWTDATCGRCCCRPLSPPGGHGGTDTRVFFPADYSSRTGSWSTKL